MTKEEFNQNVKKVSTAYDKAFGINIKVDDKRYMISQVGSRTDALTSDDSLKRDLYERVKDEEVFILDGYAISKKDRITNKVLEYLNLKLHKTEEERRRNYLDTVNEVNSLNNNSDENIVYTLVEIDRKSKLLKGVI